MGHLIQNAIEATCRDGQVWVRLRRENDLRIVEIKDTGHGMSEEFIREKLFKPFESTKSAGMGIGVFESREYVSELGGEMEVSQQPIAMARFSVLLCRFMRSKQAAAQGLVDRNEFEQKT